MTHKIVNTNSIVSVDPTPQFDLSPHLYMQTLEPLGATDTAIDAAWDYTSNCWRKDLISAARALAPSMVRWGGNFIHYYRWKEAIGPRDKRKPIYNLSWGGIETNQVGTTELIDFCRQVKADPLITVSLAGDGRKKWQTDPKGNFRFNTAPEVADWVDYCNNPDNSLRISHGYPDPLGVKYWQLGNETSYGLEGSSCYHFDTAAKHTIAFAKAMRKRDPSIKLIGVSATVHTVHVVHNPFFYIWASVIIMCEASRNS
jgi:alpha-N-arabinofuranosidase